MALHRSNPRIWPQDSYDDETPREFHLDDLRRALAGGKGREGPMIHRIRSAEFIIGIDYRNGGKRRFFRGESRFTELERAGRLHWTCRPVFVCLDLTDAGQVEALRWIIGVAQKNEGGTAA